jgi:hypothetical protein
MKSGARRRDPAQLPRFTPFPAAPETPLSPPPDCPLGIDHSGGDSRDAGLVDFVGE